MIFELGLSSNKELKNDFIRKYNIKDNDENSIFPYIVKFDGLDDLMCFIKDCQTTIDRCGSVIVGSLYGNHIEIYDSYRE